MGRPEGFSQHTRKSGEVEIRHHGMPVTTLRGEAAVRFLRRVEREDEQAVMARATGNYKRGNERQ